MRWLVIACLLSGCTSQFTLGPASTWAANNAPVIPGFHPVPIGGGGFIEEPDAPAAPAAPALTSIETTLEGLDQAQKVRMLVRQLAR